MEKIEQNIAAIKTHTEDGAENQSMSMGMIWQTAGKLILLSEEEKKSINEEFQEFLRLINLIESQASEIAIITDQQNKEKDWPEMKRQVRERLQKIVGFKEDIKKEAGTFIKLIQKI